MIESHVENSAECPGKRDHSATSTDGFLDHGFKAIQPKSGAHRSGMDALLLAATVPEAANGLVADMGSGSGVAGMAVAHRCRAIHVDLLEIDSHSFVMARNSLDMKDNAHLSGRVMPFEADLTATGKHRSKILREASYDHIISNPPYNGPQHQSSPNADKARAHRAEDGFVDAWMRTASFLAKPKARLSLIIRPDILPAFLAAMAGRFGDIGVLPVHSKTGENASRLLITAQKQSKAPLHILPPLVLHRENGAFTETAENIFRGRDGLRLK